MIRPRSTLISLIIVVAASVLGVWIQGTTAFVSVSSSTAAGMIRCTEMSLSASPQQQQQQQASASSSNRRDALFNMATKAIVSGTAVAATVWSTNPSLAVAKYSDYSRREEDWETRQKKGEIKISTARDLRKQLAEIVPQNDEGSKVFCPNGPSAAVSPLMENRCSDVRMAIPSVYGRSADVVGNSIPGFQSGSWSASDGSSSITTSVGGFPAYYSNK